MFEKLNILEGFTFRDSLREFQKSLPEGILVIVLGILELVLEISKGVVRDQDETCKAMQECQ